MIVETKAIILSSIKYGDNSRIVKCFTYQDGIKTFIIKNVHAKKNKLISTLSPLNQVEIIYNDQKNYQLTMLKNCQVDYHYQTIYQNQIKITMVLFLAEILNQVLHEEHTNQDLHEFITKSLQTFDLKSEEFSDFHLWFLLNLTRYLGFYPSIDDQCPYFDMANGVSTHQNSHGIILEKENFELLKSLTQINFTQDYQSIYNRTKRKTTLDILVKYYELHISDFRQPNSLEVLHQIFE